MKKAYYFFSDGTLQRKDNTLRLCTESGAVRDIPVENISDIYCFGMLTVNTHLLSLLSAEGICMHIFNHYGTYRGTYYPAEKLLSGRVHICQAVHYLDQEKRMALARAFLKAGTANMLRNLRYYNERGRDLSQYIAEIRGVVRDMPSAETVEILMGLEGNARKTYYAAWNGILAEGAEFAGRVRNPPDNMVNSLISFSNMLVYACTVTELYNAQLDPTISYLHEPGERRFSLSLDMAEVFKPLLADRMIFSLINRKQITDESFEKGSNGLYLKEDARKLIVAEFDKRLAQTIKHKTLGRSVSYRRLIRLEAYKLTKHVIGEEIYEGFEIWW